jgi:hypothetical protein
MKRLCLIALLFSLFNSEYYTYCQTTKPTKPNPKVNVKSPNPKVDVKWIWINKFSASNGDTAKPSEEFSKNGTSVLVEHLKKMCRVLMKNKNIDIENEGETMATLKAEQERENAQTANSFKGVKTVNPSVEIEVKTQFTRISGMFKVSSEISAVSISLTDLASDLQTNSYNITYTVDANRELKIDVESILLLALDITDKLYAVYQIKSRPNLSFYSDIKIPNTLSDELKKSLTKLKEAIIGEFFNSMEKEKKLKRPAYNLERLDTPENANLIILINVNVITDSICNISINPEIKVGTTSKDCNNVNQPFNTNGNPYIEIKKCSESLCNDLTSQIFDCLELCNCLQILNTK